MPIAVGETFERYEIESLIGRGGMGDVYRAVDTRLRRKVALKVLRPDRAGDEAVARLFREARSAASLSHPNTVAVHDIGEAEGISYIVMELVSGAPLLQYVGDDRVPVARRLGWLVDAARALSAAHKAGVIHRDVKPSNIMVSDEGIVKVLDFGLAKSLAPVSFRTQQGHVLGTPRYMSPEQLAGEELDARSDQYAFALTAYELLSGKHPGGAISGTAAPPMLDLVVPQITRSVAQVIDKAISTRPVDRFAAMEEVVVALEDAIAGRPVRGLAPVASESAMSAVPETVVDTAPFGASEPPPPSEPDLEAAQPTLSAPPSPPAPRQAAVGGTLPLGARALDAKILPRATSKATDPPAIATLLSADAQPRRAQAPAMKTLLEAGAVQVQRASPSGGAPASSLPSPESERAPEPPLSRTPVIFVALVVLGVVAFAGAYVLAKQQLGGGAPPATPSSTASAPAASVRATTFEQAR